MLPNGRIDIATQQYTSYAMATQGEPNCLQDVALRGTFSRTPLSDLFFSPLNLEALQKGLFNLVFAKSCQRYRITRQSDDELLIIMRSVYLQHSRNEPHNIVDQVKELNGRVLDFCVPRILAEIESQREYQRTASVLPVPMERAQNMSSKGTKDLELKEF